MRLMDLQTLASQLDLRREEMLLGMPAADSDFLDSMVPQTPGASEQEIRRFELESGGLLANTLRRVLLDYDLTGLELAGVVFGRAPPFISYLRMQIQRREGQSIAEQERIPKVEIASSTGYVLSVALWDGRVSAVERDFGLRSETTVAKDIDLLLRALSTLVLTESVEDESVLARELTTSVGAPATAEAFWRNVILGFA